jgi:hypothetical protein
MALYLKDIGDSEELRTLISQVDINNGTISLILDQPRTLRILSKTPGKTQLIVRCRDTEARASVVLHLPFHEGERGSAHVIDHT